MQSNLRTLLATTILMMLVALTGCSSEQQDLQTNVDPVAGDLNDDKVVDQQDYQIFLKVFGAKAGEPHFLSAADIVADGIIDVGDFKAFTQHYDTMAQYGDFDMDGDVDGDDYDTFRSGFGKVYPELLYSPALDADADGSVGVGDFGQFRSRFGR